MLTGLVGRGVAAGSDQAYFRVNKDYLSGWAGRRDHPHTAHRVRVRVRLELPGAYNLWDFKASPQSGFSED